MNKHSHEFQNNPSDRKSTVFHDYLTSDTTFDELFAEFDVNTTDQNQPSNTNLPFSFCDSIPAKYHELTTITSNEQANDSSSSSISFPPSISVTYDQLQSLIPTSTEIPNILSDLLQNSTIIGHNIPLKIVSSTSSDLLSNATASTSAKQTTNHHHRRKPSHNIIEKRYRSSINEKLDELKEIVAANEEKVQKSGILRRTIDYIHRLESINQRLEEENSSLKIILKQFNLTNDNQLQSTSRSSSISTDEANEETRKQKRRTKRGMGDGSRLTLCCFMFCLFLTNPFHYLLNQIHSSETFQSDQIQSKIYSRTLQSTIDHEYLNLSSKQIIGWMLNIAVCLVCLVKIFIYGEASLQKSDLDEYVLCKKRADQCLQENRYTQAYFYYQKSCEQLSVPINRNSISTLMSVLWQICRLVLNIVYIGRWLTSWSGWIKSPRINTVNFELNSCCIQLWKIEYQTSKCSILSLFNLFLLTLNTAINSEKGLDSHEQTEIYLLAILTIKMLPRCFSLFILCLQKKLFKIHPNELDSNHLTEFLLEKKIHLIENQSLIDSIRIQYFQYILCENIRSQLLFGNQQEETYWIRNECGLNEISWWQFCFQMMQCIINNQMNINGDEDIYEQIRAKRVVDSRYITIMENLHIILVELNNDYDQMNFLFDQLGLTSRLLISMIRIDHEDNFDLAIKTLFLDGILALRLRLLTNFLNKNCEQIPFLDDFQQELEMYQQLNQWMKLPKQRYHLFEAIFRISSGLNPLITEILFESAIKQRQKEVTSNLDILSALLLFCYFSPSTINRYRTILQQAVIHISIKTNRNPYLNRLQRQCLILMNQSYLTL